MGIFTPEKKCPFCGYTKTRIESHTVHGFTPRAHHEYWIMCLNCGACGPNDLGRSGAVKMWDMRRQEWPGDKTCPAE